MLSSLRILVFCSFAFSGCASVEMPNLNDLIKSLDNLIDFLILDIDNVDADCLLGIVVTEAQFNLLLQEQLNLRNLKEIETIRDKCNYLTNVVKPKLMIPSEHYREFIRTLLVPDIWQVNKKFESGLLTYYEPYVVNSDIDSLRTFMFSGEPNETMSDGCLSDLIKSAKRRPCAPKQMCQEDMLDFSTAHGYPLTHKLLYFQIARGLKCLKQSPSLQNTIVKLCSIILRESRSIENLNTTVQQDLYVEQMVLCGLEGFQEFLEPKARKHLVDWQTPYGCYGNKNYKTSRRRLKRMNTQMLYDCSSHYSGLAAAALAINIKYLIMQDLDVN